MYKCIVISCIVKKGTYPLAFLSITIIHTNNPNFSRQDMYFRGAAAVVLKSELKVPFVFDLFILQQAFYL